jgi:ParB family chromosome partitioning protein
MRIDEARPSSIGANPTATAPHGPPTPSTSRKEHPDRSPRLGAARNEGDLRRIPVALISVRADQPRQATDPGALEELTASIRERGVLQPIRVRPRGQLYEIIAGERRWTAARRAGLDIIPAVVVEADDDEAYIQALIENIQREDLNPIDRGHALSRLRVDRGLQSWEEVGRLVGITRQHVHNLLNLAHLPAAVREELRGGSLTEKHGRALLRLRGHPAEQRELWERIHAAGLSGDDALTIATAARPRSPSTAGTASRPQLRAAIGRLRALVVAAAPGEINGLRAELTGLVRSLTTVLEEAAPGDQAGNPGRGLGPAE